MALVEDFSFEGHCCPQGEHGVELECRVCPETIFVKEGDAAEILRVIGEHEHQKAEGSRPCHRKIVRRSGLEV